MFQIAKGISPGGVAVSSPRYFSYCLKAEIEISGVPAKVLDL
jgi:hypothetical protein